MRGTIRRLAGSLSLTALMLVASVAASPSLAERLTYTYDDLGRLESLTYDAAGNRMAQIVVVNTPPVANGGRLEFSL